MVHLRRRRAGVAVRVEGQVRITLTTGFATQRLMPRLRDFWALHPGIALSLHPDPRTLDLRREGMDIPLRFGNGRVTLSSPWQGRSGNRCGACSIG